MSLENEQRVARYTILSTNHMKIEFPNGEIDVWMRNVNIDIHNPAEMPGCISALLDSLPFEHEPFMRDGTHAWNEYESTPIFAELLRRDYKNFMKVVKTILKREAKQCRKFQRDVALVRIRKRK